MIGSARIAEFFRAYLDELERRQVGLDRLDAIAGDGDHGATMIMGMREVVAAVDGTGRPGDTLRTAAEAFGSVGGSIGPLWGTALVRAARTAGESETIDLTTLADLVEAAAVGIQERGRSEPGDKTLLDVMQPAATAFAHAVRSGLEGRAALEPAIAAAQAGLAATAEIKARRGRARRLADRSVGSLDPGAASACLGWETAGRLAGMATVTAQYGIRNRRKEPTMGKRIGFIGLGIMGRPMARNLIRAGYELVVRDLDEDAVGEVAAEGAETAASAAEVASVSDIIITMLLNSSIVSEVVLGAGGVLEGARQGSLLIDMSTIDPSVARRLAARGAEQGVAVLDAPVSGGEIGAQQGTLSIMAGGTATDFARAEPLFEVLGKTIVHVGQHGAGQQVKACNQVLVAITYAGVSEALVLGSKAGIDPALILDVLSGGLAANRIMEVKRRSLLEHDFTPGGPVNMHHKDLMIALEAGRETEVPLPLTSLVQQMFEILRANGHGGLDHSALLTVVESWANHRIGGREASS
jgi:2-hydroxy-3-oxopropionate reductase